MSKCKVIRFPDDRVTVADLLDSVEVETEKEEPRSLFAFAVSEKGQVTMWACGSMSDLPYAAIKLNDVATAYVNGRFVRE